MVELDAAADKAVVGVQEVDMMWVKLRVSGRGHNVYRKWPNRC